MGVIHHVNQPRRGRPSVKRDRVVEWLRHRMVSGKLAPGAQLPTHAELMTKFDAGADTIQSAMDELATDGVIESRHKSGSFVVERPPYLNRYAVVYMQSRERLGYWSYMYRAIETASSRVAANRGLELAKYEVSQGDPRMPDHAKLLADVHARRVAGIIFTVAPHEFLDSPITTLPGVPRIALTEKLIIPGISAAPRALNQFGERAANALRLAGRKRAAITSFISDLSAQETISRSLAAVGISTRPHWFCPTEPVGGAIALKHYVHVLLDRPASERPDSIVVTDDNLVEFAVAGVRSVGLIPGDDITIVSLGNMPSLPPVSGKVTWIAFDNTAILDSCIEHLSALRSGGNPAPLPAAQLISIDSQPNR